jgi:hypothetical protein
MGDIIASLPSIRALGGGRLILGREATGHRKSLSDDDIFSIKSLLDGQPYIVGVESGVRTTGCIDFTGFRGTEKDAMNLANWQAKYVGAIISIEPWLSVKSKKHGRPVVSRTARYHNPAFPWGAVIKRLGNPLFIGSQSEYEDFQEEFGCTIEYCATKTLLSVAQVVAGASVFAGNQSCPFWIAAALGIKCIQETCLESCDSILNRSGMYYPAFNGYKVDESSGLK